MKSSLEYLLIFSNNILIIIPHVEKGSSVTNSKKCDTKVFFEEYSHRYLDILIKGMKTSVVSRCKLFNLRFYLQDVLRNWYARNPQIVETEDNLVQLAHDCAKFFQQGIFCLLMTILAELTR